MNKSKIIYIGYVKESEESFESSIVSLDVTQSDFLGYWKIKGFPRLRKIGISGDSLTECHMEKEIKGFNIYNPTEKTVYFYSFNYKNVDKWVDDKVFQIENEVLNRYQKLKTVSVSGRNIY